MEFDDKNSKLQIILSILGVFILVITIIGVSYAAFIFTKEGQKANSVRTGTVTMTYTDLTNGISIENAIPMTEEQGMNLSPDVSGQVFNFTVSAKITGKATVGYEIVAEKDASSTIDDQYIRLYLEKSDSVGGTYTKVSDPQAYISTTAKSDLGAPIGVTQLATGSFSTLDLEDTNVEKEFTQLYRLRMWVDTLYELTGEARTYKVVVNVYGKGLE